MNLATIVQQQEMPKMALIDDDPAFFHVVARMVAKEVCVTSFRSVEDYLSRPNLNFQLVGLDIGLPGSSGLDAIPLLRDASPHAPIIMLTANVDPRSVIAAIRKGAFDYMHKPVDRVRLRVTVRNALEHGRHAREMLALEEGASLSSPSLVGVSPGIRAVRRLISSVAPSSSRVLLEGPAGADKVGVARTIHKASPWSAGPFVAATLVGLESGAQEVLLFGNRRGESKRGSGGRGLVGEASGGTLFLNDIECLAPVQQSRLMGMIAGHVTPEPSGPFGLSNVRVVVGATGNLAAHVARGHFRADLFVALSEVCIDVPTLASRLEDLPFLVQALLREHTSSIRVERGTPSVDGSVLSQLTAHTWPGDVSELANLIRQAALLSRGTEISLDDLPRWFREAVDSAAVARASGRRIGAPDHLPRLATVEKRAIEETLSEHDGNISAAARVLGITRATLYRKARALGLVPRPSGALSLGPRHVSK